MQALTSSMSAGHELDLDDDANPFFQEEQGIFPDIKVPGYSIKWVRCSIRGENDMENIASHLADRRFGWTYLRPDDIPSDQSAFRVNKHAFLDQGDVIRVKDTIAMKCPAKRMRQWREHQEFLAQQQANGVQAHIAGNMSRAIPNSPASVEETSERGHGIQIDE